MNNGTYWLSGSSEVLHFEKNLQISPLGKLFNEKLTKLLEFEVVASYLLDNGEWISICIKERGKEGDSYGSVFNCEEENILRIQNATCQCIWNTLCESLAEMGVSQLNLYVDSQHASKKLCIKIYDFVKRSRFGFFMDYPVELEQELRRKYPDVHVSLRCKDFLQYYYLIFATEEDLDRAKRVYGIENMNHFIWELCKREDTYGVFREPIPMPEVLTKQEVIRTGRAMGIMRENLKFPGL